MKLNVSDAIKKILVISLSNIGDCILTFPVIDILRRDFPMAEIFVVVGPKAEGILAGNPSIKKVLIFDKQQNSFSQLKWILALRKEEFDLVVDLRNTAIPFLLGAKYRTPLIAKRENHIHMKQKHLNRLKTILGEAEESLIRVAVHLNDDEIQKASQTLVPFILHNEKYAVIAPGAANHLKRWKPDGFAQVADVLLAQYQLKIIFVGDENDEPAVQAVVKEVKGKSLNLCGKTSLKQLTALLKRATLVIANDSGTMHIASYLDVPTIAIFGPTNHVKYGPWGKNGFLVKSDAFCTACEKPNCSYAHECMDGVSVTQVLEAVKSVMSVKKI